MKKSTVCEYLQKRAGELSPEKSGTTATAWMMALVGLPDLEQLPEELSGIDALEEIIEVKELLDLHIGSREKAMGYLTNVLKSEDYDAKEDVTAYNRYDVYAVFASKDTVKAKDMLEQILKNPTDILKGLFEQNDDDEDADEDEDEDEDESDEIGKAIHELLEMIDSNGEGAQAADGEDAVAREQALPLIVERARTIQQTLLENVFGQDLAVNTFVSGYFQAEMMALSSKRKSKPRATFLFAGPPGVGKTFLAETAAAALGLPFKRFDMSEYSDKDAAVFDFCGINESYKGAKPGNVTDFVAKNPKCVLLFDEIEKAHINIIHLFLQMLDAGRLRDSFMDEEVSFTDTYIIMTTNAGRNLYNDPTVVNLSALPKKKILKALSTDADPATQRPFFPAAICSRLAAGNVVMFDHLEAKDLLTIVNSHMNKHADELEEATGLHVELEERIPTAMMLSEGGHADARTVGGRAAAFFYEELYELLRLMAAEDGGIEGLKRVKVDLSLDQEDGEIRRMFEIDGQFNVLLFGDPDAYRAHLKDSDRVTYHVTSDLAKAKEILFDHDIAIVLCDVYCGLRGEDQRLLNAEDIDSDGRDFMSYVLLRHSLPVYLLERTQGEFNTEEYLSFAKLGARGILTVGAENGTDLDACVEDKCRIAYQQRVMDKLARENKLLLYHTSQVRSEDGSEATIHLFDLRLGLATDVEDQGSIVDDMSKPNITFDKVIGAAEAKRELTFFVDYLKDPVRFLRKGVRPPKGVLLYGPPGTGKTLLAKAMAGESDVTFLRAEGNQFLKRYLGEGPDAIHRLFNAARKYAPSILFIDEIDSIAKNRGTAGANEGGSDALTALLTEMDGFNTDTTRPVFVLAATNYDVEQGRARSLDPALLRRFDRRILVDLPNKEERRRYLDMVLAKHPIISLSEEQLDNIAMRSTGMSLAELESVVEMALRNAIRSNDHRVDDAAFEDAFETFQNGERRDWDPDTLKRTARHEAGHALLCWKSGETPSYLTVVARGDHGGYMQHGDCENKMLYTKDELMARIRTALGGRAAEMVCYGEREGLSTGASGDLHQATALAERMICCYGMDDEMGLSYLGEVTPSSPVYGQLRARTNEILRTAMDEAVEALRQDRAALDRMVEVLMDKNHLKADEIDAIFGELAHR